MHLLYPLLIVTTTIPLISAQFFNFSTTSHHLPNGTGYPYPTGTGISTIDTITCYTTEYATICPTGLCTRTYTITEHCPSKCTTRSAIPSGFTTHTTLCEHCGPEPTTVTLTQSCETECSPLPTGIHECPGCQTRTHTECPYGMCTKTHTMTKIHSTGPWECPGEDHCLTPTGNATVSMPPIPTYTGAAERLAGKLFGWELVGLECLWKGVVFIVGLIGVGAVGVVV